MTYYLVNRRACIKMSNGKLKLVMIGVINIWILIKPWKPYYGYRLWRVNYFLITIGDRSVGGLTARDQLVGPWQVPVSDVAVTALSFKEYVGEAMAIGERMPIAVMDASSSVEMAIGELITNIVAADLDGLSNMILSANWMAACGEAGEDAALFFGCQNSQ